MNRIEFNEDGSIKIPETPKTYININGCEYKEVKLDFVKKELEKIESEKEVIWCYVSEGGWGSLEDIRGNYCYFQWGTTGNRFTNPYGAHGKPLIKRAKIKKVNFYLRKKDIWELKEK